MPDASVKPAGRGPGLLLEALVLNLLLAVSTLSALDGHWAGFPVWPAPWVLGIWYLARLFRAWRGGRLGHFLRWHLLALVPATAASVIGTIVALPFVIPLLGEAAGAGLAGIIFVALAALPFMWAYFIALPAGVWFTRRWLPGRPAFARAWRDTMLGLAGLFIVTAAPMLGVHRLAERAPMPEPVVIVHPEKESPGVRWVLKPYPLEPGRYTLAQCRQAGPPDQYTLRVPVADCRVVDHGQLFEVRGGSPFQLFDPTRLPPAGHAKGDGLFLCQGNAVDGGNPCYRVWIPATPATDPFSGSKDAFPMEWKLAVQPPRLLNPKLINERRIEACKPAWLPRQWQKCMHVSFLGLPISGSGEALTDNIDQLFNPGEPRLRVLLADPGHRLYLHVASDRPDTWSRLGIRPAPLRIDYYPLRIPPFPGKDKRGGSAQ